MKKYKAIIAAAIALGAAVANQSGIEVTEGNVDQIVTTIIMVGGIIVSALADPPKKSQ